MIGVSVLRCALRRLPIVVICTGIGKPQQTGELTLRISNPNEVSLTGLCIYIDELPSLRTGQLLDIDVPAAADVVWHGSVPQWPTLPVSHETNELPLSGRLTFRFAHAEEAWAPLSNDSKAQVDQVFRSGMDINDFLR